MDTKYTPPEARPSVRDLHASHQDTLETCRGVGEEWKGKQAQYLQNVGRR